MNAPKRIICVGHTAFDRVFMLERIVAPPAKVAASHYFEMGGGMAANAAVAIARLGARAVFWGPAGDDATADAMATDFARYGVDATRMHRLAGCTSSHSAILVDATGERLIVSMRGDVLRDTGEWLPLAEVDAADALLADVRWPPGAIRALQAARAAGVPTILDADTATPEVQRAMVPLVDYPVFSESGFTAFHPGDTREGLARALTLGARAAVVTRGEHGCEWLSAREPERLRHLPAFSAVAVDTTGAGDSFHGAFALQIAEGASVDEACTFAAAAAALKVEQRGSRSMPSRAQVEARLGRAT